MSAITEPDISVVVTAYNYAEYLPGCLDSLLNQSIPKSVYEIIVVNDNSVDDTADCLALYEKCNDVTVITSEKNLGVAGASNLGIQKARGKYIVRVDADDFVSEYFLHTLYQMMLQRGDLLGCACDYDLVDIDNNILEKKSANTDPIGMWG